MRATIEEVGSEAYWHMDLEALPAIGHTLIMASADRGVRHRVIDIEHHVGSGSHRIVIRAKRLPPTPVLEFEPG